MFKTGILVLQWRKMTWHSTQSYRIHALTQSLFIYMYLRGISFSYKVEMLSKEDVVCSLHLRIIAFTLHSKPILAMITTQSTISKEQMLKKLVYPYTNILQCREKVWHGTLSYSVYRLSRCLKTPHSLLWLTEFNFTSEAFNYKAEMLPE